MAPETGKNSRKAPRILIVDDDASQRSLLDSFLTSQKFETVPVASGEKALEVLRTGEISMMISDVRMPGISGLETLRRARQAHALLPILLVTAYTDIREAVGAMRDGAVNYLGKPIDLDELLASVRQATGLSAAAPLKFNEDKQLPGHVVARSPLMQAVFGDVSLIAPSESRVLITGESGVGKEVVVDVMHAWSARASGPLVKVNCAAIPETLLESELFGHERGAFTGAAAQRIGRFELANGGTIFLDEIAEMSTVPTRRLEQRDSDQRPDFGRQQPESGRGGQAGRLSRRPVLPVERGGIERSSVARAPGRHPAFGQPVHDRVYSWPRAVLFRRGRVSGALSLAGQCARTAQCDGTSVVAFPRRSTAAGAPFLTGAPGGR